MKSIIKSPAKINLFLSVDEKRKDGYHNLSMIMQKVSLYDIIEFEIITEKYIFDVNQVNITCNNSDIPTDDKNLMVKIIKYIFNLYNIDDYISINLIKNIPTCAGLGGGSSDAATTLLFLNEYYKLNLSKNKLNEIAVAFGADIPFFLYGSESICKGKGEKINELKPFNSYYILIAKPNIKILTKDIFNQYDISNNKLFLEKRNKLNNLINAINNENLDLLAVNLFNDLELVTCKNNRIIADLKEKMVYYGAKGSLMTGSGSAVYGVFDTESSAIICKDALFSEYSDLFLYIAKPI